jgi:hypothetical protein
MLNFIKKCYNTSFKTLNAKHIKIDKIEWLEGMWICRRGGIQTMWKQMVNRHIAIMCRYTDGFVQNLKFTEIESYLHGTALERK